MSRSYRHSPVMGWAVCRSEKPWKRLDHKMQRQRLRQHLAHGRYEQAEVDGAGIDVFNRGKDGRQHWWQKPVVWQTWSPDGRLVYHKSVEEQLAEEKRWMRK